VFTTANQSQMHPVHSFPPYFRNINSNTTFPFTPKSSEWSLPFRFSDQKFVSISRIFHACYMLRPSHGKLLGPRQPPSWKTTSFRWSDCLCNIFAATLHICRPSLAPETMVTGTHITWDSCSGAQETPRLTEPGNGQYPESDEPSHFQIYRATRTLRYAMPPNATGQCYTTLIPRDTWNIRQKVQ